MSQFKKQHKIKKRSHSIIKEAWQRSNYLEENVKNITASFYKDSIKRLKIGQDMNRDPLILSGFSRK